MLFSTIEKWIFNFGLNDELSSILSTIAKLILLIAFCVITYYIVKLISAIITKLAKTKNSKFIVKRASYHKLTKKISWFILILLISGLSYVFPNAQTVIIKIATYASIIVLMVIIDAVFKIICDFYATKAISKKRPIKGIMQITEILIFLVFGILLISLLINQNPLVLIGGIGTFTAILSIVFKDALLGLVAGVQITSDDLLRIGDWVEIPSQNVEGTVQDISLITVKILAFDNTLFTIPAYTFLSVPFKNWHTAINDKARRVNRTISIDIKTVKPLNDTQVKTIVKKYNYEGLEEALTKAQKASGSVTNLVVFRELLVRKIKEDDRVCSDRLIVCQVGSENSSKGIPVEFIFFTNQTDWVDYSEVSASKMDLALYIANELDLKMFQERTDVV